MQVLAAQPELVFDVVTSLDELREADEEYSRLRARSNQEHSIA